MYASSFFSFENQVNSPSLRVKRLCFGHRGMATARTWSVGSSRVVYYIIVFCLNKTKHNKTGFTCSESHESELWKSKAGVLVYKDRGGFKIDLATGQN